MDKSLTKLERSRLSYNAEGYALVKQFIPVEKIAELLQIVRTFHQHWCKDNNDIYQSHAINSADLTAANYLSDSDRLQLFQTVASEDLHAHVSGIFEGAYGFMNTQLFFDPVQPTRKNYWHRDPQWHLTLEQQKESLEADRVIHCRIALIDERGIELIPQSHQRWDSQLQQETRLGKNGRQPHDDLPNSKAIALNAGDLLIFNGNMIHRGLYGHDRMALDILFCDAKPELLKWANPDCLPAPSVLEKLDMPEVFRLASQFASRR